MDIPKKNTLIDESLAAESKQGADDVLVLPERLDRYAKAHQRTVQMSKYAMDQGEYKVALKMRDCGNYLLFRDYYTVGKVRLHAAQFCKKHLLCPLCAIRRGSKMVSAYMDRLEVIKAANPGLKASLVTLTVKDGDDLQERFLHLQKALQKLHKARVTPRMTNEACKALGAVWSYEFKRGKNSGQWHPHVHCIWLHYEEIDHAVLSSQWHALTGDSYIVDVTAFHDQENLITGFLEVFKYACKFSDLPLVDNWIGYSVLSKRRLIASFGLFRGVEVSEDLLDIPLDELPYVEHLFRFMERIGYSLLSSLSRV